MFLNWIRYARVYCAGRSKCSKSFVVGFFANDGTKHKMTEMVTFKMRNVFMAPTVAKA